MASMFRIILQGIFRRKRESLLVFLVLLISFAFAIVLLSYTESVSATNSEFRQSTYGTWLASLEDSNGSERVYVDNQTWVDSVGTSVRYCTVNGVGIGTVDSNLVSMGIHMASGHLPVFDGQMAVESDALDDLGYSFLISEKWLEDKIMSLIIPVVFDDGTVLVQRDFELCGIISEYTGLWSVPESRLNGAIVTQNDAESILAEAQALAESYGYSGEASLTTLYFVTAKEGMEEEALSKLVSHISGTSAGSVINKAVTSKYDEEATNTVYVGVVLLFTLLAILSIYILQLPQEVKRIVRFRSIGASKLQVSLIVLSETLILCIPAMLLGTFAGMFGIWLLLGLSVYSGSVAITVKLPWNLILIAVALWLAGVIIAKMITFQVALATPMTGKMTVSRGKAKASGLFCKGLIFVMSLLILSPRHSPSTRRLNLWTAIFII